MLTYTNYNVSCLSWLGGVGDVDGDFFEATRSVVPARMFSSIPCLAGIRMNDEPPMFKFGCWQLACHLEVSYVRVALTQPLLKLAEDEAQCVTFA